MKSVMVAAALVIVMTAKAFAAPCTLPGHTWIARSNAYSAQLTALLGKYAPEQSADPRFDADVLSLTSASRTNEMRDLQTLVARLERDERGECDQRVRTDIGVLAAFAEQTSETLETQRTSTVPYEDVSGDVYAGISGLLNATVPAARHAAALERLKAYAGLKPGTTALTLQAQSNVEAALHNPGLLTPSRAQLRFDLANSKTEIDALGPLFARYGIRGYAEPLHALQGQIDAYNGFLQRRLLPRSRVAFQLPRNIYVQQLRSYGIYETPEQLIANGHRAFAAAREQVQAMADRVAREQSLPHGPFQNVVATLRNRQIADGDILSFYRARARDIDAILRREGFVPVPPFPLSIRLATPAESARIPAPFFDPPPLIGSTTAMGTFVLPTRGPDGQRYTDFFYDGAGWMLSSHEGRPGHALQFWSMLRNGTSNARAIYAFNSANVEGWGMYAEWLMQPYMPDEGKLATAQFRLARIAYSFLDPELQTGRISAAQARDVLVRQVGISPGYADSLIRRFTYLSPGQGPSYFYGYSKMRALRAAIAQREGAGFQARAFHDAVLREGLLPFDLLDSAVESDLATRR